MNYREYKAGLEGRYWEYWESRFSGRDSLLRPGQSVGQGPPVFDRLHRDLNVLSRDDASARALDVRSELRPSARHRWFGSFHSSQALAQSVFANLKHHGKLELIADIRDDDGIPVFFDEAPDSKHMVMEFSVDYLGEREGRSTEVDVFFGGPHRVCVECKFTENEVGSCSRPRLSPNEPNFEQGHCDGSYRRQRGRSERCSLTEIGVQYWEYLPGLVGWRYIQVVSPEVGCSIVDPALSLQAGLLVDMTQPMTSSSTPGEGCEGSGHQKGG